MSGLELERHIAANLARLREAIAQAATRVGRRPGEVKLVAVSKNQSVAAVRAALAAGQHVFGENTVQDALTKRVPLATCGAEWHFIGHLQSNKARLIPGNFSWLHTLDSAKLADRLARLCALQSVRLNALIEVNVTRDPAKQGVTPEAVLPLLEELLGASHAALDWRGLMTVGPHPAKEKDVRATFASLRDLRDRCRQRFNLPGFTELSMGMSGDFEAAIEEGATMVRAGTAIFGERDYTTG